MIEDALKSARTLHRLIMTLALTTIVFGLSIQFPSDKARQKELIDQLIAVDFKKYDVFIEAAVSKAAAQYLNPISIDVGKKLEDGGYLVFGLGSIAKALSKPIHVGKILTKDLALLDIQTTSISHLDGLNGLSLKKDAQFLIPRTDALVPSLDEFFKANGRAGTRVTGVRTAIIDASFTAESFLPGSDVIASMDFQLLNASSAGAIPIFESPIHSDIRTLPNTSFLYWLMQQNIDPQVILIAGDKVRFIPEFDSAPPGLRTEKLGTLSLDLGVEIAKSSPASQSLSVLGSKVPGALVIFASPIILLALSYYLANHTSHLKRLCFSHSNQNAFSQFAWLPLSLKKRGLIEVAVSGMVLPLAAIGLLYLRLQPYGTLTPFQLTCMAVAFVGIIIFGSVVIGNIGAINHRILLGSMVSQYEEKD